MKEMYDDVCYECTGYGDDYFVNDEGELEPFCPLCPYNDAGRDEDEAD